jgi:antitoxin component YwqK of YwqJK toxin-antitoxin module
MNKALLILLALTLSQTAFCQNSELKYDDNGQLFTGIIENPTEDGLFSGINNDIKTYENGNLIKHIHIQYSDTIYIKNYSNGREVYTTEYFTYALSPDTKFTTIIDTREIGIEKRTSLRNDIIEDIVTSQLNKETGSYIKLYEDVYKNNNKHKTLYYENGVHNGHVKLYLNGVDAEGYYYVRKIAGYDMNEVTNYQTGKWKYYYKNGNLKSEGSYATEPTHWNDKTGNWLHYYENGTVKSKGKMSKGNNVGLWQYFYESGELKEQGTFKDGYLSDVWEGYYKNGEVKEKYNIILENKAKKNYDIGVCTFVKYFISGQISEQGEFILHDYDSYDRDEPISASDFRYHNKIVHYYENGNIKETGKYFYGEKYGKFKYYEENGKLIKSEKFK